MGMQAEGVGRIAHQISDDVHRLELWAIAMELEEESNAVREHAAGSNLLSKNHTTWF
jgi:hypothetical protein